MHRSTSEPAAFFYQTQKSKNNNKKNITQNRSDEIKTSSNHGDALLDIEFHPL